MVSEAVKRRVAGIETKEDFDEALQSFMMSNAPLEVRDEAIKYLKAQHHIFDNADKVPSKELLQEIRDGEADIDDIGGFN